MCYLLALMAVKFLVHSKGSYYQLAHLWVVYILSLTFINFESDIFLTFS